MPLRPALQRIALFIGVTLFAGAPSGCLGCGGDLDVASAAALRRAFPEQASLVLETGKPMLVIESEGSFVAGPSPCAAGLLGSAAVKLPARAELPARVSPAMCDASHGGLTAKLPVRAEDPVRFNLPGDVEIRVRERGIVGDGAPIDRAIAYAREGGASYWTATASGYEEWIHLAPGAASAGHAVAVWEIEGATPRQEGSRVVVDDESGAARLVVTAPYAYAEGGRPIEVRLVASASTIELWADAADNEAVLIDPLWTVVGSLASARNGHAAVLLPNGKALIVSGSVPGPAYLNTNEVFDPVTQVWSGVASIAIGRAGHSATVLANGKILVAGGYNGVTPQSSELYDPATNTWSSAGVMISNVTVHTATLLLDGKVLIASGQDASITCIPSAQLYDPATNTWSSGGAMITGRCFGAAARLPSGKVLVTGGSDLLGAANATSSAEIYNPATNTWSVATSMSHSRMIHTATLLQNNKVIVAGGSSTYTSGGNYWTSALYDEATNSWMTVGTMSSNREAHTATLLPSGKLLVAGGTSANAAIANVDLFDPALNTWANAGPLNVGRGNHSATLLMSGKVLVAGGATMNGPTTSAEIYSAGAVQGSICAAAFDCVSGFCADGFCCNTACGAGPCDACSIAAGGAVNGTCAPLSGPVCNDGNLCSQTDVCQAGVCTGANPVMCAMPDQCHDAGMCNPATGTCSNPVKANGTACNDMNGCTQNDTCQSGACTAGPVMPCPAPDGCHVAGACDMATGMCSNPAKPDGSMCSDNNACSVTDTCQAGMCVGASPVVCAPLDSCHEVGVCNPATGACSNPVKAEGAACDDGNACTESDTCKAGACAGGGAVDCPPPDSCHDVGACNPVNGVCSYPNKADGAACDDGSVCTKNDLCKAGVCSGDSTVTCEAIDECHEADACDPASGACLNPPKPDGTPCSGGVCTAGKCASQPSGSGSGSGSGGDGSGGNPDSEGGGCGCGVSSSPTGGVIGVGLALLFMARRRRRAA